MQIRKRDNSIEEFNPTKVESAILRAFEDVNEQVDDVKEIAHVVCSVLVHRGEDIYHVEEVQDLIEEILMLWGHHTIAKSFVLYREKRRQIREFKSVLYDKLNKNVEAILTLQGVENANANVDERSFSGRNNKVMATITKQFALDNLVSGTTKRNHIEGKIYIHDLDNYASGMPNCLFVDFTDLFNNEHGFKTRNGDVREPSNIMSFMQLVAVVFQCQSQAQFGGIGSSKLDYEAAPYVHKSFVKNFKEAIIDLLDEEPNIDKLDIRLGCRDQLSSAYQRVYDVAYRHTLKDTKQACESLFHNLNTLESRPGSQVPFTSINFGTDTSLEGRLVTRALLEASIEGIGNLHRTSIFPISIFKVKKGVNRYPGDPNYDLFQLALESLSKRIYPNIANLDSPIDNGSMIVDEQYATMGCRTAVGPDINGLGDTMTGRGNIAPSTINLVDIGIDNGICLGHRDTPDLEGFYKELDKRLYECKQGLLDRYEYIASQKAVSSFFTYSNGLMKNTLGRKLEPQEEVRECVKHGSLAIGFIGIAEMCKAMFGSTHSYSQEAYDFAYSVVTRIREYANKAKKEHSLNFVCYATPAEGLCSTFRDKLVSKYGIIEGVTDREFISNSYHIPVYDNVSVAEKSRLEAPFCFLCNGGNIHYVELQSSVRSNLEALEDIVNYSLDQGIRYLAINTPIDTCNECGYSDEINNCCPVCGSDDIERLRRVTGYITKDYRNFNKGKIAETESRVKHAGQYEDYGKEE